MLKYSWPNAKNLSILDLAPLFFGKTYFIVT